MNLLKYILVIFSLTGSICLGKETYAQKADPAIAELAQFEYLRGEWDVGIQLRRDDGSFELLENRALVRGFYLGDGRSFQTIFSTVNGGLTTDIRSYDIQEKKWQILFMNARAQRWHQFEARLTDGNMVTLVPGGYSGKEDHDVRIIDSDISPDHFTKEVFHRQHGSEGWKKIYIMNYERIK